MLTKLLETYSLAFKLLCVRLGEQIDSQGDSRTYDSNDSNDGLSEYRSRSAAHPLPERHRRRSDCAGGIYVARCHRCSALVAAAVNPARNRWCECLSGSITRAMYLAGES